MFATVPTLLSEHWQLTVSREDGRLLAFLDDHYSCKEKQRKVRKHAYGPGEDLALMTATLDAAFVWNYERYRLDGQTGINCVAFRNVGEILSSDLIREAVEIAWEKWPGERLFTFVNGSKVRSSNPGYCFLKAKWERCGRSAKGLLILEKLP